MFNNIIRTKYPIIDKITEVLCKDTSNVSISAYALTSGSEVYTSPIPISDGAGYMSLLAVENKAGGAGDVDISAEYSLDGTNFYTVYTSNMSGTISAEGNIVTALGDATRWIIFTPRMAKFVRFKLDPDANSQLTLTVFYKDIE